MLLNWPDVYGVYLLRQRPQTCCHVHVMYVNACNGAAFSSRPGRDQRADSTRLLPPTVFGTAVQIRRLFDGGASLPKHGGNFERRTRMGGGGTQDAPRQPISAGSSQRDVLRRCARARKTRLKRAFESDAASINRRALASRRTRPARAWPRHSISSARSPPRSRSRWPCRCPHHNPAQGYCWPYLR